MSEGSDRENSAVHGLEDTPSGPPGIKEGGAGKETAGHRFGPAYLTKNGENPKEIIVFNYVTNEQGKRFAWVKGFRDGIFESVSVDSLDTEKELTEDFMRDYIASQNKPFPAEYAYYINEQGKKVKAKVIKNFDTPDEAGLRHVMLEGGMDIHVDIISPAESEDGGNGSEIAAIMHTLPFNPAAGDADLPDREAA
jgi:hypothetical protein